MKEIIDNIQAKIKLYDELESKAHSEALITKALMYSNQKIGLLEALEIIRLTNLKDK